MAAAITGDGSLRLWGTKFVLIAGQFVRPFVKSNKTDVADAQAIWEVAQRPGMKFVALKTEEQQSVLTLHRIHDQLRRIETLDRDIARIEKKLLLWKKQDESSRKLMEIPGVGLLTATAAVATMGDAWAFKSGREFAAFLGLVPRQSGTGGRVKLLGISKRGDVYLRTLLIHGARSVIQHQKEHSPWLTKLLSRRPRNAVVVALANKMARTIWALLAHDRTYDRNYAASAE